MEGRLSRASIISDTFLDYFIDMIYSQLDSLIKILVNVNGKFHVPEFVR